jgi:hypothetical protein
LVRRKQIRNEIISCHRTYGKPARKNKRSSFRQEETKHTLEQYKNRLRIGKGTQETDPGAWQELLNQKEELVRQRHSILRKSK